MFAAIREHLAASAPHDAARAAHESRLAGAAHGTDASAHVGPATAPPPEFEGTVVERFCQALEAVAGRCLVVRDEAGAREFGQE